LQSLFNAPTIAEMAQRILGDDDSESDALRVLVSLKQQGNRSPLFCVHPVFGFSWSFIGLSKHLHPEQPIYGLQARGLNGRGRLASSIEDMARDYIDQIRQVQPQGPYNLLGWSFGGSVVHSMAVQLDKLGEKVALLALMDSKADYSALPDEFDDELDGAFYAEHIARSGDKGTAEEGKALWDKAQHVIRNNFKLAKQFSPSPYCGNMLYFSATVKSDESEPIPDPADWAPFVLGSIEVHEVDCEHLEMDKPEPMVEIGRVLSSKLKDTVNNP
ncbi:hypothetical protein BGZ79_005192, partial [Entomortierella chlamydospora]